MEKLRRPVVIVADWRESTQSIVLKTDDLDLYTKEQLDAIVTALRQVCDEVVIYSSPKDLIDNISQHSGALVIPLWAGRLSRNRTALVSAISEAYELKFFGPDVASGYGPRKRSPLKWIM
jgi:hypothetical protein